MTRGPLTQGSDGVRRAHVLILLAVPIKLALLCSLVLLGKTEKKVRVVNQPGTSALHLSRSEKRGSAALP